MNGAKPGGIQSRGRNCAHVACAGWGNQVDWHILEPRDWQYVADVLAVGRDPKPADRDHHQALTAAFLGAAYAGAIPWDAPEARLRGPKVSVLLEAMARNATTEPQLAAVFAAFDAAWAHGQAGQTGRGGGILLDRAQEHIAQPPLPANWMAVASQASRQPRRSSGVFWATSMIHAVEPPQHLGGGREIA